jgi:prepilin-type processing-associated H-X9-DG protein
VKSFACPSDQTYVPGASNGLSNYAHNGQVNRVTWSTRVNLWTPTILSGVYPSSIPDGTSNTLAFTERMMHTTTGRYTIAYWPDWGTVIASSDLGQPVGAAALFQTQPAGNPANCNGDVAASSHLAGINVGMFDGHVKFVSSDVSWQTWWAAFTPAGGETPGSDW